MKRSAIAGRHQAQIDAAEVLFAPSVQSTWFYIGATVVVGVASAVQGADAQRRAAHTNADISRQKAKIAVDQAGVNEDAQRRRAQMVLGQQRAAAAESGSDLSTGTNADLATQSATNAELDALNIRYQGKLGQLSGTEQAGLDDMRADDATTAGQLGVASAALSGYGSYLKAGTGVSSSYNYNGDAGGTQFSTTGESIRARR